MFTAIKMYIGLGLGIIVAIFVFMFKRRGDKIEDQEEVIIAKDMQLDVQEQVFKSKVGKTKLEGDINTAIEKTGKNTSKMKASINDTINDTENNVPYKVEI